MTPLILTVGAVLFLIICIVVGMYFYYRAARKAVEALPQPDMGPMPVVVTPPWKPTPFHEEVCGYLGIAARKEFDLANIARIFGILVNHVENCRCARDLSFDVRAEDGSPISIRIGKLRRHQ